MFDTATASSFTSLSFIKLKMNYLRGFGNEFRSEANGYKGTLPIGQVNPQRCKLGLFAEQLSGTAFTAPRSSNRRSWFYRKAPSVCHQPYQPYEEAKYFTFKDGSIDPNQRLWKPYINDDMGGKDFVQGIHTLAYSDATGCAPSSVAIHIYLINRSMGEQSFTNSDGDFLIVPQIGKLQVLTEFGELAVEPNEICVIQQGMKFTVNISSNGIDVFRGYILEVKGNHFELPERGLIGANGLANSIDFMTPTASCIDERPKWRSIRKFQNNLFIADLDHRPYNVVAWFGNYVPYKYNLSKFVAVNSVSVDHPDPSIFTVLTCPLTGKPGTALADFVIFPPRWECANNTFRPPYYHRNCMTEFMGLIKGQYQAKSKFKPGGGSLHQAMMPHGPDGDCLEKALKQNTEKPTRVAVGTMAFMFETSLTLKLSKWALEQNNDPNYHNYWCDLVDIAQAALG